MSKRKDQTTASVGHLRKIIQIQNRPKCLANQKLKSKICNLQKTTDGEKLRMNQKKSKLLTSSKYERQWQAC